MENNIVVSEGYYEEGDKKKLSQITCFAPSIDLIA